MNTAAIMKLAITRLLATKTRSFLTMLGVIIGVASLVALTSIANGATSGITDTLSSLGATKITVSGNAATALDESDAYALRTVPGVAAVSTSVRGTGTAGLGSTTADVTLTGVSATYEDTDAPDLALGSWLSDFTGSTSLRQVVLSATAAQDLSVTAADLGDAITLDGLPFTLVGVLDDANSLGSGGTAYVTQDAARATFALAPWVSSITVVAASEDSVDAVQARVDILLRDRYGLSASDDARFSTSNQASLLSSIGQIQGVLSLLLGGIASISLVVGGIGIMNIMLVSVRERVREIGVRRAIGAKRRQILAQFLIEAVVLSLVGGLLGLGVGLLLSALVAAVAGWAFVISPSTVVVALVFSGIVGVVFGVWPARTASRLQPIDALRSE